MVAATAVLAVACAADDSTGGSDRASGVDASSRSPSIAPSIATSIATPSVTSIGSTGAGTATELADDAAPDNRPGSTSAVDSTDVVSSEPDTADLASPASDPGVTATPGGAPPARDFAAVDASIDQFVAERGLNGAGFVVVDAAEGVVHEHYAGVFSPERISFVASSSKMVTAGVLMRLHDDGLLDIDAPVADVVEWGVGNPDITPAQLVSNSSGLVGLLPDPAYGPYLCQFVWTGTMQDCAAQIFTTPDDDAAVVPPDTQFRYGGGQWQVAGAVAEAASGTRWNELVEEIYVEPCGLESLGYNNHLAQIGERGFAYPEPFDGDLSLLERTDNPNMEAGLYTTPGDYAALLLMHLRGGWCGDQQVLSRAALDRLHADRIGDIYGSAGPGTGYGMGWWVDRASGRIYDPGAYGSVPWLDLADGYGAYLVIEADAVTGSQLAERLYDAVDESMTAAS